MKDKKNFLYHNCAHNIQIISVSVSNFLMISLFLQLLNEPITIIVT